MRDVIRFSGLLIATLIFGQLSTANANSHEELDFSYTTVVKHGDDGHTLIEAAERVRVRDGGREEFVYTQNGRQLRLTFYPEDDELIINGRYVGKSGSRRLFTEMIEIEPGSVEVDYEFPRTGKETHFGTLYIRFRSNSANTDRVATPTYGDQQTSPTYSANVRGVDMSCTSFYGEPVAIIRAPGLGDVGMAGRVQNGAPVIYLNPTITNKHSRLVTQWWFAHECAHHALDPRFNSETNADCYGIQNLRAMGLISNTNELNAFSTELQSLPGSSSGHLPGPARARNIINCALN